MNRVNSFLKTKKIYGIGFILWIFAISTPLLFQAAGTHAAGKKYKETRKNAKQFQLFLSSLSNEQKAKMYYLEHGVIKKGENDYLIVGEEISDEKKLHENEILAKRIEYEIVDHKRLVLQAAINEIKRKLSKAENALISDFYATIIVNDENEFFLVINKVLYSEYVSKYGSGCYSCGDN